MPEEKLLQLATCSRENLNSRGRFSDGFTTFQVKSNVTMDVAIPFSLVTWILFILHLQGGSGNCLFLRQSKSPNKNPSDLGGLQKGCVVVLNIFRVSCRDPSPRPVKMPISRLLKNCRERVEAQKSLLLLNLRETLEDNSKWFVATFSMHFCRCFNWTDMAHCLLGLKAEKALRFAKCQQTSAVQDRTRRLGARYSASQMATVHVGRLGKRCGGKSPAKLPLNEKALKCP